MQLTDGQKGAVRSLVSKLGLTQGELSKRARLSASALSEALKPEGSKGIGPEKWEDVRRTLRELVAEQNATLQEKGLAEAARQTLAQLRGAEEGDDAGALTQPPGGPLKPRAANYVERSCDTLLTANLYRSEAPAIILLGGLQFGKTSLLHRFASRAEEHRYLVSKADARELAIEARVHQQAVPDSSKDERWDSWRLFEKLFGALGIGELPAPPAEGGLASEAATSLFGKWIADRAPRFERLLLLIDSLDLLLDFVTPEAFDDLLAFFAWIRTRSNERHFERLTLVVVYSGRGWSAAYASKFQSQAFELDVPPFRVDHAARLFKLLDVSNHADAEKLHKFFLGHPHLIHLGAFDLAAHGDLDLVLDIARAVRGGYRTHWEKMQQEVKRFSAGMFKGTLEDIWQGLVDYVDSETYPTLLPPALLHSLGVMGLVYPGAQGLEISEFYLSAMRSNLRIRQGGASAIAGENSDRGSP